MLWNDTLDETCCATTFRVRREWLHRAPNFTHSGMNWAVAAVFGSYGRLTEVAPRLGQGERLLPADKAKKLALTARMRKLLLILNAMVKNSQPWRPLPVTP